VQAEANTEKVKARLVGVSSAPARTWIENAAKRQPRCVVCGRIRCTGGQEESRPRPPPRALALSCCGLSDHRAPDPFHKPPLLPSFSVSIVAPPPGPCSAATLSTSPTVLGFLESKRGRGSDDSVISKRRDAGSLALSPGGSTVSDILGASKRPRVADGAEGSADAGLSGGMLGLSLKSALQHGGSGAAAAGAGGEGGLGAMLRGGKASAGAGGIGGSLGSGGLHAGLVGSGFGGAPGSLGSGYGLGGGSSHGSHGSGSGIVLAASFRDPASIPMFPAGATIDEDDEEGSGLESDDSDAEEGAAVGGGKAVVAATSSATVAIGGSGAPSGIGAALGAGKPPLAMPGGRAKAGAGRVLASSEEDDADEGTRAAIGRAVAAAAAGPAGAAGGIGGAVGKPPGSAAPAGAALGGGRHERAASERDDGIFEGDFE